MIQIDKEKNGRVIKVKHIKMSQKEYDEIKDIYRRNTMHDAEIEIAKRYNLETLTEGYKVMMAVANNYKYLEVI